MLLQTVRPNIVQAIRAFRAQLNKDIEALRSAEQLGSALQAEVDAQPSPERLEEDATGTIESYTVGYAKGRPSRAGTR